MIDTFEHIQIYCRISIALCDQKCGKFHVRQGYVKIVDATTCGDGCTNAKQYDAKLKPKKKSLLFV